MIRLALLFCLLATSVLAQSQPGWKNGQVHSATEFNTLWAGKQDCCGSVPPVISGCTGCTLDATASATSGTITEGTTQTGFVLTFATAFLTAPHCLVTSPTGHAFISYTVLTTSLAVVNGAQTGSKYTWACLQ